MTHNELASAILNRVTDGLSGSINNLSISTDQLMDEIDLLRAEIILKYDGTKKLDLRTLEQTVDNLVITCVPYNQTSCADLVPGFGSVPTVDIPELGSVIDGEPLSYVGLVNKALDFPVFYDIRDVKRQKLRIATRHKPYVWADRDTSYTGKVRLYFFNLGAYEENLTFISVRGIFAHPSKVHADTIDTWNNDYPAPGHVKNMILDTLSEKYIRYYRELNVNHKAVSNEQRDLNA